MLVSPLSAEDRVPWTSSRVTGSLVPPAEYRTVDVFPSLAFDNPVSLTKAPGTQHLFLLQLDGKIFQLPLADGEAELVVDLKQALSGVDRVFGLTFHPQFERNRLCFICYTREGDEMQGTVVSRFRMTTDKVPRLEIDSERIVITWRRGGHNGGCLKFGLDGYLYISAGDAGPAFPPDPLRAGQDLSNVLATIMRIDVDRQAGDRNYAIPSDNPFVGLPGARGEIWAYGFRNPWRIAFDEVTGDLWVGDVGWELWEMIQCVEPGDNYGWSLVEGPHAVHDEGKRGPTPIVPPAAAHSHTEARSITGGQVYYSDRLPDLKGAYVYGDHVTGKIWSLRREGDGFSEPEEIARSPLKIICFGTDHQGEVYIVGYGGRIHRLERNPRPSTNHEFPRALSDTGLFASVPDHTLAPGVLKYEINAEPWMDGATATRFFGVPGDTRIGIYGNVKSTDTWAGRHKGTWKFPKDTVIGKTVSFAGRRLETQVLHYDGNEWQPYSYAWGDDQQDADLVWGESRAIDVVDGQRKLTWNVVSQTECRICHSTGAAVVLGFRPDQLDGGQRESGANQLARLESLGYFDHAVKRVAPLVDPHDANLRLSERARSYLHVNCAHCHRRGGGGAAAMDVRFNQSNAQTNLFEERPTQGTFFLPDPAVVASGDPYRSVLYYRLAKLGRGRMPYFGTNETDERGLRLIHDWILSLSNEPGKLDETRRLVRDLAAAAEQGDGPLLAKMRRTDASLRLSHAISAGLVDHQLKSRVLAVVQQADPHIFDLFERFRPPEDRAKPMGATINVKEILAQRGDVDRGKQLFQSTTLSCKNCHATTRGEKSMGPNLAELSEEQYRRSVLLENIMEPSRSIKEEYTTYLVQTEEGQVHSGLIEERDGVVILRDQKNQEVRIPADEIELRVRQQKSVMPERMLNELTLEQAIDLLDFLQSLK